MPPKPAALARPSPDRLVLSGGWTAAGMAAIEPELASAALTGVVHVDAAGIEALDSVGAWRLRQLLGRPGDRGGIAPDGLRPEFATLLEAVANHLAERDSRPATVIAPTPTWLARVGLGAMAVFEQAAALLGFVGECALAFAGSVAHPKRIRWRTILYHIRSAGFDALPIVGLLSFLLGVVVAYQGAGQLRQYGANIFVVDLVGLSMLREFAPLITAIIVAGRSGSAYAAQIGSMAVSEEIDAMRTLGIAPLEQLVLPKIVALLVALPLLTVFADGLGVFGGMIMARTQLDVGFPEFLDRFVKAVDVTAYLVGIGKAPVFAVIIALVGCFQGFRAQGGADGVGRQTTRSVVQAIFLVIVADALFSIAFSILDL